MDMFSDSYSHGFCWRNNGKEDHYCQGRGRGREKTIYIFFLDYIYMVNISYMLADLI